MRRLPVFILIDSSTSMKGEAIDAVNAGLKILLQDLRKDPFALETVFLSVISFNTTASIMRPFIDILNNDSVTIEAKGQSNLGLGLQLLIDEIKLHIKKASSDTKGDWRPLIFFMTDGRPSGAWKARLKEFHSVNDGKWVVCACGMKTNLNIIESMGGDIIILDNKSEGSITQFFKWISSSINIHSKSIVKNNNDNLSNEKYKIYLNK